MASIDDGCGGSVDTWDFEEEPSDIDQYFGPSPPEEFFELADAPLDLVQPAGSPREPRARDPVVGLMHAMDAGVLPMHQDAPRRRRLTRKQPAAGQGRAWIPVPDALPGHDAYATGPSWLDIESEWPNMKHRHRYKTIDNKFRKWTMRVCMNLCEADPGLERWQQDCFKMNRRGVVLNKDWVNPLKHEFLLRTQAPASLISWSEAVWPCTEHFYTTNGKREFNRSATFLFTFQGDWGYPVIGEEDLVNLRTIDDVVQWCQQEQQVSQLWRELKDYVLERQTRHHVWEVGCALELCNKTWTESRTVRVHAHAFLMFQCCVRLPGKVSVWRFKGSPPHNDDTPLAVKRARNQHTCWSGMFYCTVGKIGTIHSWGSVEPFLDFPVRPQWVTNLLQKEKITYRQARTLTIKTTTCTVRKLADLDRWKQATSEDALEIRVQERQNLLRATHRPFRVVPEVVRFLRAYDTFGEPRAPLARKKICVLYGPSRMGKTEYVRSLFAQGSVMELNCANMKDVCLVGFDHNAHRCILWDEATVSLVVQNRKVFQHPCALVDLGHSPTAQHVRRYWLNDAVSFLCNNTWLSDLQKLTPEDREWVESNSVVVPVFEHLAPE